MKSYNNLYEPMTDEIYIESKIWDASKGKRNREDVAEVFENMPKSVNHIKNMMMNEGYHSPFHIPTKINESSSKKTREIVKPFFWCEQVVHHMFVGQFKQIVMRGFYEYSCGSIPDRGVHYAKRYIEKKLHAYGNKKFYVLKMDIRHFYASVDRDILKSMLNKQIRDKRFYNLACEIIDYDGVEHGKGLPLGFYTSQWFGNYFLKGLDHFIKEQLHADTYVRYVDDMVIFDTNKRKLHRMVESIQGELAKLGLELKGNWQVFMFESAKDSKRGRALDFLGFVFHRNRTTLRKSLLRAARRKANRIWAKGKPTWYAASQMLSYCGWFYGAKAHKYFQKWILSKVNIRKLKRVVSKHSRKVEYEKLARSYC